MVAGESVYGENRVVVQNEDGTKVEYRLWDSFQSKLAAAILDDVYDLGIAPGDCVLYLGAASGVTVLHVSDIVGPIGRPGTLANTARKQTNVIPVIEDARHLPKYQMSVGVVDAFISDISQPYQANRIDPTAPAEAGLFIQEIKKLHTEQFKPIDEDTLETHFRWIPDAEKAKASKLNPFV